MLPLRDYPFDTRPMIIAHRGDTSKGAKENSLEAIASAVESRTDMVEVDVQWSSDRVFVCYHDESIEGSQHSIAQTLFAELEQMGIVRLETILRAAKGKLFFNLEVKEYSDRDPKAFMRALSELIVRCGVQEEVLISSFRIDYIRQADWTIPTVIIHPDDAMQSFFSSRNRGEAVVLDKPLASYLPSELMKLSHATSYACQLNELNALARADIAKYNILLSVYTIHTEPEFHHALLGGARALVCERPAEAVQLRDRLFPSS